MYTEHVPIIAHAMRHSLVAFQRGVMFAAISARVPFPRACDDARKLRREGDKSRALWGWKWDTYQYVHSRGALFQGDIVVAGKDTELALARVMLCPGMGVAKGAFVLQMMGHDVACIDTRNAKRLGFERELLRGRKYVPAQAARNARRYLELVSGRAQELWDTWCTEVAHDYGEVPNDISWAHVDAIVPGQRQGTRAYDIRRASMRPVPYWPRGTIEVPF